MGKARRGTGTKITGLADAGSLPLAASAASTSLHEVILVETTSKVCILGELRERLPGDKAYDSERSNARLTDERGVVMIVRHRGGRRRAITQDGHPLPCYQRRWKIERLFAWRQNFCGLVVWYEYHLLNFFGMVQLGCIVILLRKVLR